MVFLRGHLPTNKGFSSCPFTGSTRVAVSPTPANTPYFPESYYINTESGSSLLLAPAVPMCLPAALTPMGCQGTTNEAPTFQCMPTSCATFPRAANAIVHGHRPPLGAIFASESDAEAPERAGRELLRDESMPYSCGNVCCPISFAALMWGLFCCLIPNFRCKFCKFEDVYS